MIKNSVRYFNGKPVRAVWDFDNFKWWYSSVDLIRVLTEPNSPRRYWNNVKIRNPELSPFCGQLKLYSTDGKKYLSDVIDENGINLLITIIPTKYRAAFKDWLKGLMDPLDERSKKKAYELFQTDLISDDEIGKTISLQKIHAYLFDGLYEFAGKIRTKTISKNGFTFANGRFLPQILKEIENMPESTVDQIIEKYVEMNIAHPFMEGNGRSTRIWLDLILIKNSKQCIDWSLIDKNDYLNAMKRSPIDDSDLKRLIKSSLTPNISDRENFIKGIDYSYYYEETDELI